MQFVKTLRGYMPGPTESTAIVVGRRSGGMVGLLKKAGLRWHNGWK
ncbi:hypothetical protein CASFOL_030444 [Castilleja foliolosa]|uniref:Uncharacterized protein n=1 Tax=Castilleja foliolosa TaxID=1961234 RepID=A0ABD3CAV2_9LAMI